MNQKVASSMFLQPPTHTEVFNIIHSLRLRKSSGHDNIDSYFIRIACDVLTPYLIYLFHLSFEFGFFPDCLKTAKIIPIFKAGLKTDINQRWSPRGRPWPRGHILKPLALASRPQVFENCPVLGSRIALFFEP